MPESIADCLPHPALWIVLRFELDQVVVEALEDRFGLAGSYGVTQGGACSLFSEAFFYAVEVPYEFHDERGMALFCFESFVKFSSDVSHAATQRDVDVRFLITGVGAVAITLKSAVVVRAKGVG